MTVYKLKVGGGNLRGRIFRAMDFRQEQQENHFIGQLKAPASLLSGATISREGFTMYAAAYIYQDIPDILSIDQNNEIKLVSDALS